ncbi:MAG: DUF4124 domain-containing protein [Gammaproteobacteria bacterium]
MKRALLMLLVLGIALPVMAQTVYRWVDKDGVVHYSDQPVPGAVKVNLGAPQVLDFKIPSAADTTEAPGSLTNEAPREYQVTILAPADGTTLRPAQQQVHARVSVAPPLGPRAVLQYQLDGKSLGEPTVATQALIKQVYRGAHTLTVTVIGPAGAPLGTASSTFYVHQHSILLNGKRPGPPPGPGGG